MWRILNILAIAVIIGSAVYAYSIKYETILYAEQIRKMNQKIADEHDQIAVLRAAWAKLTRPERIAGLVAANLDTQPLALTQIVRIGDLPDPAPKVDTIGQKLDALGFGVPTHTPRDPSAASATTPSSRR